MRNPIGSLVSGIGHVVGGIFGSQLDFLSGKSCSSLCGPTWDVGCYIENFCIEHLLKFFAVSFLVYLVLLLLYLLHKLGVFHCIFKVVFRTIWACFHTVFSFWERSCQILFTFLLNTHRRSKIRRNRRDIEMADRINDDDDDAEIENSVSCEREPNDSKDKRRMWSKRKHLRKSLRAKNHRAHVAVDGGDAVYVSKRKNIKHDDVRVVRTSNHKRARHVTKKKSQ